MIELFYQIVYNNYTPIAWINDKYKMYKSIHFLLDALLALSED